MKLAELKRVFNKKYVIRIIAGVLTVTMVGTQAAVYQVRGAEEVLAKTVASGEEERDTEQTGDKLSDLLNGSISLRETEIGKEETVYIIADSTGEASEVIVSDHLLNKEEQDVLADASDLKNITNVKGDQEYRQDGTKLTWQAEGSDIFYQGTTDKQAPVTEKLTYYLDGKEISPEELAGKSGRVTIRFDYTNHEKVQVTIDGKTEEIYVPFAAITGMILDDSFRNVEVTNGRAIADGSKNLVIGYALPGLKESLAVSDEDFDRGLTIPEYVEVTADVENFSLDMTMTAIVNATNFISAEGENDLSSVEDMIDALTDAGDQLENGSGELAEGLDTLLSKLGEFTDGVNTLKDGIENYTDGASRVAEGIGTLKGSTPQLSTGISQLGVGISAIYDNFGSTDNQSTLRGGAGSVAAGAGQLSDGANMLSDGLGSAADGAAALSAGAGRLSDGANALSAGAGQLSDGAAVLSAGAGSVSDGAKTVDGAVSQLSDGAAALADGAVSLQNGVNMLVEKVNEMELQMSAAASAFHNTKTALLAQCGAGSTEELNGRIAAAEAGLADIKSAFDAAEDAEVKNSLMENYSQTSAALGSLKQAQSAIQVIDQILSQLPSDVNSMSGQLDALNQGAAGVAAGAGQLSGGLNELKNGTASLSAGASEVSAGADSLREGASTLKTGADDLREGASSLWTGADTLKEGVSTLKTGADGLREGASSLKTGADGLFSGVEQLYSQAIVPVNAGMSQLSGSMPALLSGVDLLNQGASELVSNNSVLNDGAYRLSDAAGQLTDGVRQLDDGAHQLADGIVTFNESGISEIVNAWQKDAKPLFDRIQAVLDAGAEYQSFTKLAEDVNGSVRFIYKTAAIK